MGDLRRSRQRSLTRALSAALGGRRAGHDRTRPPRPGGQAAHDEAGAVLILALVFLIVVGGVVGVLANSVSSHLEDSTAFASSRSLEYAAKSAVDLAIDNIRYAPLLGSGQTLNASPPSQCWNTGSAGTASQWAGVNGEPSIAVWCSTAWQPTSSDTRVVTISACIAGGAYGAAAPCAATPLLQDQVAFDDYPSGASAPDSGVCSLYCGSGENVLSSLWSPTVPSVTDMQLTGGGTAVGPITGGTGLTITGSGFVQNATSVNFIQESGGVPASVGSLAAIPATVLSSTSLTVQSPAVTQGSTYYVTVTTPTGTSGYTYTSPTTGLTETFVFTYQVTGSNAALPTVTSMSVAHTSPAGGTNNGGDLITITGSNFYAGATVDFIEQSGGSQVVPAIDVTVDSNTQLTAVTPGVTTGTLSGGCSSNSTCQTKYLVQVTTVAGSSTPVAPADQYTYNLPLPLVSGIGSSASSQSTTASGLPSSPLVITGRSFWGSGTTVEFYSSSTLCSGSGTTVSGVTVNSPTSITVTVPSTLTNGSQHCVGVNTTPGNSANVVVFTVT